jgi:hypothetical protein
MIDVHIELVKKYVQPEDILMEPFYGNGNYYRALRDHFPGQKIGWAEIALGRNFFDFDRFVDVVITNPPYSCITQCLEKCIDIGARVISFLIGGQNIVPNRLQYMKERGYSLVQYHVNICKQWKLLGSSITLTWVKDGGSDVITWDCVKHSADLKQNDEPTYPPSDEDEI